MVFYRCMRIECVSREDNFLFALTIDAKGPLRVAQ